MPRPRTTLGSARAADVVAALGGRDPTVGAAADAAQRCEHQLVQRLDDVGGQQRSRHRGGHRFELQQLIQQGTFITRNRWGSSRNHHWRGPADV